MGATGEGAVTERLHLGLGIHFGYMGIVRATTSGSIGGFGLGAFGFASYDVVQSDEGHALYVGARITANGMDGGTGPVALWGPSATLGWRY